MLVKIISGGQTGADRAGLIVAKTANLQTGGWMPKGFLALDGPHPEFAALYGIKEHSSPLYPPRTFKNAEEADGTVRFASHWGSSGELCTLKAINKYRKPYFDVGVMSDEQPVDLAKWITENNVRILNVAGNSERTCPGISEFVQSFLSETILLLKTAAPL